MLNGISRKRCIEMVLLTVVTAPEKSDSEWRKTRDNLSVSIPPRAPR